MWWSKVRHVRKKREEREITTRTKDATTKHGHPKAQTGAQKHSIFSSFPAGFRLRRTHPEQAEEAVAEKVRQEFRDGIHDRGAEGIGK